MVQRIPESMGNVRSAMLARREYKDWNEVLVTMIDLIKGHKSTPSPVVMTVQAEGQVAQQPRVNASRFSDATHSGRGRGGRGGRGGYRGGSSRGSYGRGGYQVPFNPNANKVCNECGVIGHIRYNCPLLTKRPAQGCAQQSNKVASEYFGCCVILE